MAIPFQPTDVDPKDPDETEFYYMDWAAKLSPTDDTISTSSWVVQSGLTGTNDAILAGSLKTRITLSGGTSGGDYACRNTVVTSGGRTLQRTGIVRVREQ
jgi:hypothetical protein